MNVLPTISRAIVGAPPWALLLTKITAVLLAAWLAHLALARANPRWRVYLWRIAATGLVALLAANSLLPVLEIRVQRPLPSPRAEKTAVVPEPLPASLDTARPAEIGPSSDLASATPHLQPIERKDALAPFESVPTPQPKENPASRQAPAPIPWLTIALAVWLGGNSILLLRLGLGHYRIRRLVRRGVQPPQWVRGECLRVAQAVGCRAEVVVLQSAAIPSPLLCGLLRPRLLLPAAMCDDSYRDDLPAIFAHEFTHIRSHDIRWNTALHLVSIMLWFHPLAWRIRKAHLAACELVADAVSASFVGNVDGYCRTLARVAVHAHRAVPTAGIAMARASSVSCRLAVLRKKVFHLPLDRRSVVGFGLAALAAVGVLSALHFAFAESPAVERVASANKPQEQPGGKNAAKDQAKPAEKEAQPPAAKEPAPKTALLRVRVSDESGKPLAGTKLKAAFLGHKADYTADAEGRATVVIPAPNGKFLSLIAYPDGYPPVRMWWQNDAGNELIPPEFTFVYEKGRTIGGLVRNEQGRPIQGAKVFLSISCPKFKEPGSCLALWDRSYLTDSEGRWHLDHVPQAITSIYFGLQHPDYISVPGVGEVSRAEQEKIKEGTAVMVMKKGIPVSGTVTGPDGKPVAGARVFLGEWYSPPRIETSTDQQGRYRFASLAPGKTVLTVVRPGLAPGLQSIEVQPAAAPVDFHLEQGNSLRVRVVRKDGTPIPGIFVTPDTWRGKRVLCDLDIRGRTDADGRWVWSWAPKDAVETQFGLTGRVNYISRSLPLAPRETEHVVTLNPALTLTGNVIDAETKQPVPSFHVLHGYMSTGSVEQIFWDRMQSQEGSNGHYELTISEPSRIHLVRIEADGHQPAVSREFKDDEGSVRCDFSLAKGRNLDLLVRLPDGKPAADAEMVLCPEEPDKPINMALFVKNGQFPYHDYSRLSMKAGPDGRLSIQPQDKPFLLLVLHDRGIAQTTSKELAANPIITLKAWARLEGVVRRGKQGVPGAKVDTYPAEAYDPRWAFLNFQEQTEADAQGKFVFARLKPGRWNVRLLPSEPNHAGMAVQPKGAVDLAPGSTVHLDSLDPLQIREPDAVLPEDREKARREARIEVASKVLRAGSRATEEKRMEAGLEVLRNYSITTNDDAWATAVRDLIEIGKPAVPKLIEELDHAQREETLRAVGFVLRGIGDPRAVPALIRAIPRVYPGPGCDFGLTLHDPELLKFMQIHQNGSVTNHENLFNYGRPIREIMPALEKLTGQSQGWLELNFADYPGAGPQHDRIKRTTFLKYARQWADWWSQNWRKYVTNEADAQLDVTRKALDQYAASIAQMPNPKPLTGIPWGPHAAVANGVSMYKSGPSFDEPQPGGVPDSFLDLDTGRHPSPPEEFVKNSRDGEPSKELLAWAEQKGVDLITVKTTLPGSSAPVFVLMPVGMKVWRFDNGHFQDLRNWLLHGNGSDLGKPWRGLLAQTDEKTGRFNAGLIASYLFITKEGTCGALQVGASSGGRGGWQYTFIYQSGPESAAGKDAQPSKDQTTPAE